MPLSKFKDIQNRLLFVIIIVKENYLLKSFSFIYWVIWYYYFILQLIDILCSSIFVNLVIYWLRNWKVCLVCHSDIHLLLTYVMVARNSLVQFLHLYIHKLHFCWFCLLHSRQAVEVGVVVQSNLVQVHHWCRRRLHF